MYFSLYLRYFLKYIESPPFNMVPRSPSLSGFIRIVKGTSISFNLSNTIV